MDRAASNSAFSGHYRCRLADAHKAALLGDAEEARSTLQDEVARQYLDSVTWVVHLRDDGTLESVWEVGHAGPMPPIPGHWTVEADGRVALGFPDGATWPGTLVEGVLRFLHPEVGAVEMERFDAQAGR